MTSKLQACRADGRSVPHPTLQGGVHLCTSSQPCNFKLPEIRSNRWPICLAGLGPLNEPIEKKENGGSP